MLTRPIPFRFVLERSTPTLAELKWAFDNGIIGAQFVVDATAELVAAGDTSQTTLDVAGLTAAELSEVGPLLAAGVAEENEAGAKAKWLWLLLSWISATEREPDMLFEDVDELYADFGYPDEMRSFGPYSPAYEGQRGGAEAQAEALRALHEYVRSGEGRFGRPG